MKKLFLGVWVCLFCFNAVAQDNKKLRGDFEEGQGIEYYAAVKKQVGIYKEKVENCSKVTDITECFYNRGYCPQVRQLAKCYDDLAEKIINEYYSHNSKENLETYKKFSETTYDAFGVIYCQNKFNYPSGQLCKTQTARAALDAVKNYLLELLYTVNTSINDYLEE